MQSPGMISAFRCEASSPLRASQKRQKASSVRVVVSMRGGA